VSTVKWDPKGMRRSTGLQSRGATPRTNRSAKGGARSSLHYGGEGALIHPPHQGVCGRHGTEDQYVTPGGLAGSPGGTGGSDPISGAKREAATCESSDGPDSTSEARRKSRDREIGGLSEPGKTGWRRRSGREGKRDEQGRRGGTVP